MCSSEGTRHVDERTDTFTSSVHNSLQEARVLLDKPTDSQKVKTFSEGQDILRILCNPKKHCRIHKIPSTLPALSQINPVHVPTSSFLKIHFNPLKPELNPICYLLALLAHHFLHVSRIRVKSLTFRRLMSYIYIYI